MNHFRLNILIIFLLIILLSEGSVVKLVLLTWIGCVGAFVGLVISILILRAIEEQR